MADDQEVYEEEEYAQQDEAADQLTSAPAAGADGAAAAETDADTPADGAAEGEGDDAAATAGGEDEDLQKLLDGSEYEDELKKIQVRANTQISLNRQRSHQWSHVAFTSVFFISVILQLRLISIALQSHLVLVSLLFYRAQEASDAVTAVSDETADVDKRSIFVGNVDYSTTKEVLESLFAECGPVVRVSIPLNRATNQPQVRALHTRPSSSS